MRIKIMLIFAPFLLLTACNSDVHKVAKLEKPSCKTLSVAVVARSQARQSIVGVLKAITSLQQVANNESSIVCIGDGIMQDDTHRYIKIEAQPGQEKWSFQSTQSSKPIPY